MELNKFNIMLNMQSIDFNKIALTVIMATIMPVENNLTGYRIIIRNLKST